MIARTPGIRGGRPRIAGTGVSVQRIAGYFKYWGWSAEEIEGYLAAEDAAAFPSPEPVVAAATPPSV